MLNLHTIVGILALLVVTNLTAGTETIQGASVNIIACLASSATR